MRKVVGSRFSVFGLRVCGSMFVFLAVFVFCLSAGCQKKENDAGQAKTDMNRSGGKQLYTERKMLMGTFVEVVSPDKRASQIVFDEIARVEELLSVYKENSEISRLNREGSLKASAETFALMKKAKGFWQASDGAFDVTVGPLSDLWGFNDKNYYFPEDAEIKKALEKTGMEKIVLNDADNVIKFGVAGMKVNLGGIAKGYAVDCAAEKLKKAGIKHCLINAGGDIYCAGKRLGKPWKVGIQCPRGDEFCGLIELEDQAVVTSGDYQQYFLKNKKRYSHIFNPKTGYPAQSGAVSVTVVSPDCTTADALATAIFVLGKEKGRELAGRYPAVKMKLISEDELRQ